MQENAIEQTAASAWKRIFAVLINNIVSGLFFLPVIVYLITDVSPQANGVDEILERAIDSPNFYLLLLAGLAAYAAFAVWQVVMLSKRGQTLGKRLLGIRVVKQDGSNPGFFGAFVLREAAYQLLLMVAYLLIFLISGMVLGADNGIDLSGADLLVCVVMLFAAKQRRTLQDLLAGTVVVNAPKR